VLKCPFPLFVSLWTKVWVGGHGHAIPLRVGNGDLPLRKSILQRQDGNGPFLLELDQQVFARLRRMLINLGERELSVFCQRLLTSVLAWPSSRARQATSLPGRTRIAERHDGLQTKVIDVVKDMNANVDLFQHFFTRIY